MAKKAPKTQRAARAGGFARRWIPAAYLDREGGGAALARTFGIAVAVRLVLMPIACHSDLISTYHRSWVVLNELHPTYWLPHQLIQAFFLALYSPFLRLEELLAWERGMSASVGFWLETFAPHPQVMPALFLFKVPYLLCDLGTAAILLRLFADAPAKGFRAVSMWLFNPVTIFVFYVFGRYDAVAIFFLALGVLALQRSAPLRSALALGIAIWSRYWPVFLLPFLVIAVGGGWRRQLRLCAVALAPSLLYNLASHFLAARSRPPALSMAQSRFPDYLLGLNLGIGWSQVVFVLPTLYLLLVMLAGVAGMPRTGADRAVRFCEYAVCCLALFYATAFFHPQYFTWFILFLVILRAGETRPVLRNLHYFQILLFVPYTFYWKQATFGFLLAPLDPDFFIALPPPSDWIEPFMSPLLLVNLAHTAIGATCLFTVGWLLLGGRARTRAAETGD
jgi:hypothetical protein